MTMPDSLAAVHEDGACETPAEERARERMIETRTYELITDSDWWDAMLEGDNPITRELPSVLAQCAACEMCIKSGDTRGAEILNAGIALRMGRFARTIARDAARAQAESEYNESGR